MTMKLFGESVLISLQLFDTKNAHVEHGNSAQRSRVPLGLVVGQGGVQRVGKLANDGNGPFGTGQVCFLGPVDELFEDKKREDKGKDGGSGGFAV